MRRLPIAVVALAAALCLAACSGESEPVEVERSGEDLLRSLPYAGFSTPDRGRLPSGVVVHDPARSQDGYTLYALQMLSRAELIDPAGSVVHAWSHQPSERWERAELLPGGDLLVIGAEPSDEEGLRIPDESRYLARLDWGGGLLWKRKMNAHHDVEPLPGGRLLALSFQRRKLPAVHPGIDVRDDTLVVLDGDGRLLELRSLFDAFWPARREHGLRPVPPDSLGVRPWVDLFHANSVQWMRQRHLVGRHPIYELDNVLVCLRHQNRIAVLNWSSGRLVWSWGADQLIGPHDAQVLESGNILVFDNGVGRGWSRVLEVDPGSGGIVWEYRSADPGEFYTVSKGSNQRLPNGNTLIADSDNGEILEVTPDGELVWRFRTPHHDDAGGRAAIVRATRYDRALLDPLLSP
jgi:hypothetical protein